MSSKKYSILYAINLTPAVFFSTEITAFFDYCSFLQTGIFGDFSGWKVTVFVNQTPFEFVMIEYLKVFYFPDN
jgi:hypothetical protein